jgi:hypothetical protein
MKVPFVCSSLFILPPSVQNPYFPLLLFFSLSPLLLVFIFFITFFLAFFHFLVHPYLFHFRYPLISSFVLHTIILAIQYIHAVDETDGNPYSRRRKRSVSCEVGARRVRRSCVIIPPAPPKPTAAPPIEILVADNLGFDGKFFFPNQTPNYNLTMFESSCVHWNVENETWTGKGCRVSRVKL